MDPDDIETAIRASLTIDDAEAVSRPASFQNSEQHLEWMFEFDELDRPLTIELDFEHVDERSGGIELKYVLVARHLIKEIGMG